MLRDMLARHAYSQGASLSTCTCANACNHGLVFVESRSVARALGFCLGEARAALHRGGLHRRGPAPAAGHPGVRRHKAAASGPGIAPEASAVPATAPGAPATASRGAGRLGVARPLAGGRSSGPPAPRRQRTYTRTHAGRHSFHVLWPDIGRASFSLQVVSGSCGLGRVRT